MYARILVAINHSTDSEFIFHQALSLAKISNANLMLLHVLSEKEADFPHYPAYSAYPMINSHPILSFEREKAYQEDLEAYETNGLELLKSRATEATQQGVKTDLMQTFGVPGRVICKLAQAWEANLIIVGSRGLSGLQEMLLGSVSNYVTHHAPCSVLIVRS